VLPPRADLDGDAAGTACGEEEGARPPDVRSEAFAVFQRKPPPKLVTITFRGK
jgi:hypothetical protein